MAALAQSESSLTLQPGREFAADSFVHKPLDPHAALDPHSASWVSNLVSQAFNPKYYGSPTVNFRKYTPPIYLVPAGAPTVDVKVLVPLSVYSLQPKFKAVPLPPNFRAADGTDLEAVVYQPSSGKVWEFWRMRKTDARITDSSGRSVEEWGADWGGRIDDVARNPGYFATEGGDWNTSGGVKFGTTATGISLLAGTMSIEEQKRGVVDHAIGVSLPETREKTHWSFPASRSDGRVNDENAIPEGAIFRFPANLNLDAIPMDPYARMIAKAVQKHGMVVWDTAGAVSFRAEDPADRYPVDPYTGPGGLFYTPKGPVWPLKDGKLRGFPWDKLQALQTRMNR